MHRSIHRYSSTAAIALGLICLLLSIASHSAAPDAERIRLEALGETLFFDAAFSANGDVSCATCHQPEYAFADPRPVSLGTQARAGARNSPSLRNVIKDEEMFWDGRRPDLGSMILDPIFNEREHGLREIATLTGKLARSDRYQRSMHTLRRAAPDDEIIEEFRRAIAAYVSSLTAAPTRLDAWLAGDRTAFTPMEQLGLDVFQAKAGCARCHTVADGSLTDRQYHGIGIGLPQGSELVRLVAQAQSLESEKARHSAAVGDEQLASLGRFLVTLQIVDIGRFRTPSLRWASKTAPYMHDGSIGMLEAAVDRELYYRGAQDGQPVVLTPDERMALIAFLSAI